MNSAIKALFLFAALASISAIPLNAIAQPKPAIEKLSDGIIIPDGDASLKLQVYSEDIIHVQCAKDRAFYSHKSLSALPASGSPPKWDVTTDDRAATITTARLKARVDLATGAIAFLDSAGNPILNETGDGRALEAADVQGEKTFHVRQRWQPNADESLYGLGQHQLGLMDIKGCDLDLWQHNGTVAIPFLVSSRGYGIYWDNTSYTRFGDLRNFEQVPTKFTASYFSGANFDHLIGTREEDRIDIIPESAATNEKLFAGLPARGDVSVRWEGDVTAGAAGDYLFHAFSDSGIKLWIDDQLVMDHWRQGWLPWIDLAKVHFDAGSKHHLKLEWSKDQGSPTMQLTWKTPTTDNAISLWSEVGDGIDYYFVYGPKLDSVISGYRRITGKPPMMPKWTLGLWQSRQRYETQQASLDVVDGFRSRGIPFDNIVQDWFYWKANAWGSHQFDPARFPDPQAWINAIHDKHANLMISVWGKFYPGTDNFDAMHAKGFLYEPNLREDLHDWVKFPYTFYDAFNPDARALFWSQLNRELFSKKVDAWWMDASEPDLLPTPTLDGQRTHMQPTALGSGSRMLNAYPLVNSQGIYEGQRSAAPDQRVFILTRSGFAGMQRYAAATWSGDITSTWTALRKQIPAGLGFNLSGMPWWTMDTGGFAVPPRFSRRNPKAEDVEEWRELNTRWFEFATFTPMLRVHGEFPFREMWQFGGEQSPAYQAMLKFDRLRYRMLPYIYSNAAAITNDDSTMMRALVMDFRGDRTARQIGDEYLFGPSLLVAPITTYQARTRSVYLPATPGGWYDFWTGAAIEGGQSRDSAAAFDSIPLHVHAGSIIPLGPELQYTSEKPADPITLLVYTGADADFTLYEDDGVTNAYERGAFSRIPLHWNDATRTLTIGKREGSFPGMLGDRTFDLVIVSKDKPAGFSFAPKPDATVKYTGDPVTWASRP